MERKRKWLAVLTRVRAGLVQRHHGGDFFRLFVSVEEPGAIYPIKSREYVLRASTKTDAVEQANEILRGLKEPHEPIERLYHGMKRPFRWTGQRGKEW